MRLHGELRGSMNQWQGFRPDNVGTEVGVTDATSSASGPASSVLTYEPYYGLTAKPFSLSTDPRTLYKSSSHAPVFEDLLAAIRRREGLIVLTGEMGTGKTMLCRAAVYQLDRRTFTTFVPDPDLSREDLLRMLLVGFGEVSIYELKQGRLKGTPRADLAVQLYGFLTSLESVDAFATLVIDEAQNLSTPLLDEIRALSEMEAGRRLLQIVLVGQPVLRSRLRLPEMRKVAQRVTAVCEIQPLSREGVAGYVSHRLTIAGGAHDRVEFLSQSLDLVFSASDGIPRLVNRLCDRALFYGYLDRTSKIEQAHVGRALHELEMTPARQSVSTVRTASAAPAAETTPGGLFVKTTSAQPATSPGMDLTALLNLPTVSRRPDRSPTTAHIDSVRTTASRRSTYRSVWWRRALKALSLPALGMGVMLFAGGIAVSTASNEPPRAELPPLPASPLLSRPSSSLPVVLASAGQSTNPLPAATDGSPAGAAGPEETWVVQVAALVSRARSTRVVQELTDLGWPAYQVDADGRTSGLAIVRVGPYRTAREARDARTRLRAMPDYEGAFVRNLATK